MKKISGFTLSKGATHVNMPPIHAKVGFTLAEILITLGIIGIVAAMTIPALVENIRDVRYRSQFFKSYALIQQTLKKMEADDIPLTATGYDREGDPFYKKFAKYLTNATTNYSNGLTYYTLTGTSQYPSDYLDDGKILMPDGSLLIFEQPAAGTAFQRTWIYVDLNGKKQPNRLGHDLFCFQLTDDGLKAMGAEGTTYDENTYCNKTGGGSLNGIACANKVLKDPKYFKWIKQYGN